eukprot:gene3223-5538_t
MSLFIFRKIVTPKYLRPFYINELLHTSNIVPLKKLIKTQDQMKFDLKKQIAFDKSLLKKFQLFKKTPKIFTRIKENQYSIEVELPIPLQRKNLQLKVDSEKKSMVLKISTDVGSSKNYTQKIMLPDDVSYDGIEAKMNNQGKLNISIQRKLSTIETVSKEFYEQYQLQFDILSNMGFKDRDLISKLIKKHKGDIHAIVPDYIKTSLK